MRNLTDMHPTSVVSPGVGDLSTVPAHVPTAAGNHESAGSPTEWYVPGWYAPPAAQHLAAACRDTIGTVHHTMLLDTYTKLLGCNHRRCHLAAWLDDVQVAELVTRQPFRVGPLAVQGWHGGGQLHLRYANISIDTHRLDLPAVKAASVTSWAGRTTTAPTGPVNGQGMATAAHRPAATATGEWADRTVCGTPIRTDGTSGWPARDRIDDHVCIPCVRTATTAAATLCIHDTAPWNCVFCRPGTPNTARRNTTRHHTAQHGHR